MNFRTVFLFFYCFNVFASQVETIDDHIFWGEVLTEDVKKVVFLIKKAQLNIIKIRNILHDSQNLAVSVSADSPSELVEVRLKKGTVMRVFTRKTVSGYQIYGHEILPDNYEILNDDIASINSIGRSKIELANNILLDGQVLNRNKESVFLANIRSQEVTFFKSDIKKIISDQSLKKQDIPSETIENNNNLIIRDKKPKGNLISLSYTFFKILEPYEIISPWGFQLNLFYQRNHWGLFNLPLWPAFELGYLWISGEKIKLQSIIPQAGFSFRLLHLSQQEIWSTVLLGSAFENLKYDSNDNWVSSFTGSFSLSYRYLFSDFQAFINFRFEASSDNTRWLLLPGIEIGLFFNF